MNAIHTPFQFRLPKTGAVDPWFGGNRSFWNERILPTTRNQFKPDVKSVVVRQQGKRKGVRFVLFESAKGYFDRLVQQQQEIEAGRTCLPLGDRD